MIVCDLIEAGNDDKNSKLPLTLPSAGLFDLDRHC